jgi:hypothetical protein
LSELVEGKGRSLVGSDSSSGTLSELEGDNPESLGELKESDIVGDSADDGDDTGELFIALNCGVAVVGKVLDNARK